MARNVEGLTRTPVVAGLRRWGQELTRQHAGLRLYQWLWIVLCVVAALVVAAPRVLSRPIIYQTVAETHFDMTRYGGLYDAEGNPGIHFQTALNDAQSALAERAREERRPGFGSVTYRVVYVPLSPGVVQVQGIAPTAPQAQQIANDGAAELVRQIRATGGREILRNLLGWELVAATEGYPVVEPFQEHLRNIIQQNAFPMSRPIEPVSAPIALQDLPLEEQRDVARALEARYDLWTFEINTRNATLDAWCNTAHIDATSARERALQLCAAEHLALGDIKVANEIGFRDDAIAKRKTITGALRYMDQLGLEFAPDTQASVYRVAAGLPAEPVPRQIGLMIGLAVLAGVAFGGMGVAVDRSASVMPKLRELWTYRELIRNMVLRDLRTRYKGSALGYIWTQLAPLLMMLVFLFVFTLLIPQGIPLFPVFLIVALLPWNYCSEAVSGGTRSVIDNAHLIKKVFFPREVLPLASVFSALVNYVLSLPMMFLVMAVSQLLMLGQLNFSWTFAYLPVLVVLQTMFLVGLVLLLSAMAVFLRDTVHLIGIVLQFWFFLTPVFYSLDIIGADLARIIRWLNPMASLVDFYRDILYGNTGPGVLVPTPGLPALDSVLRVLVTTLVILAFGYWFFQRSSGRFGEEL